MFAHGFSVLKNQYMVYELFYIYKERLREV